jgi:HSP20 family protein
MAKTSKKKSAKSPAKTPAKKETQMEKVEPKKALSSFDDIEQMFDEFFSRGWMRPFSFTHPSWSHLPAPFEGRTPHVNVVERDNDIFVKAELPGVEKDDLELTMTDNSVTIKGSTRAEEKEEKENYHRCEISRGSFSRTVSLPGDVDTDKAKAKFKNGVLKLTIPKVKKSKHKNIKVE